MLKKSITAVYVKKNKSCLVNPLTVLVLISMQLIVLSTAVTTVDRLSAALAHNNIVLQSWCHTCVSKWKINVMMNNS